MSQGGLSPCKTCGEEISRNNVGVFHIGRCPKCGERDPHGYIAYKRELEKVYRRQLWGCILIPLVILFLIGLIKLGIG